MEMSLGYKFFYDDHNTFSHLSPWIVQSVKFNVKGIALLANIVT